jgi:SAM-dependent methyltransferase
MQQLAWSSVPQTLTCKACKASGMGTLIAVAASTVHDHLEVVKCPQCGSIDLLDEAVEATPTEAYVVHYVEVGAAIWPIAQNLNRVDPARVRRFLDVGCSYGFALDIGRELFGWTVVGIEPSLAGQRGARELGIDIRNEFLTESTDLGEPFDLILASEVVEHVPDPSAFLAVLAGRLTDDGVLVLTTPSAEAIVPETPDAVVLSALSPGNHTYLATAGALEALLREAGFVDVRIERDDATLRAAASRSPLPEPPEPAPVSPESVTRYLVARAKTAPGGSSLAVGMSVRAVRDLVARGQLKKAARATPPMRSALKERYDLDLDDPDSLIAALDDGKVLPACLLGAGYALGFLELQLHGRPQRAVTYFDTAMRVAALWRDLLDITDLEATDLTFQSAYHRALALTRFAPEEASRAALALVNLIDPTDPDQAAAFEARVSRLFVELVMRGHRDELGDLPAYVEISATQTARDADPENRKAGLDALFAVGILKSARGDALAAQQAFVSCISLCAALPSDDAHAAQLEAACRSHLAPTATRPIRRLRTRPIHYAIDTFWRDAWGMYIDGWAHLKSTPVHEVRLETDDLSIVATRSDRADVLALWPHHPEVARCGFGAYLPARNAARVKLILRTAHGDVVEELTLPVRPKPELPQTPPWSPQRRLRSAIQGALDGPVLALGVRSTSPEVFRERVEQLQGRDIVGFDIHPGHGIDVVGDAHRLSEYFPPNHFSVVYSASLLEHVTAPWLVAAECAKVLKVGGLAVHLAPWAWPTHAEPNDFWRFSEAGLALLFGDSLGFRLVDSGASGGTVMTPTPDWRMAQLRFATLSSPAMSWVIAEKLRDVDPPAWPYGDKDAATAKEYPVDGISSESLHRTT